MVFSAFTDVNIYQNPFKDIFITYKRHVHLPAVTAQHPSFQAPRTTNLLSLSKDVHILDALYKRVIQLWSFLEASFSICITWSRLLCSVTHIRAAFCFVVKCYSTTEVHYAFSVQSFVRRGTYLRGFFFFLIDKKVRTKAPWSLYPEVKHRDFHYR